MRPQRRAAAIERATISRAVRRSAKLICVSQATERDLVALFPAAAGRTTTIPLAVSQDLQREPPASDLEDVRRRLELPESFILATGTLEPRKNLPRLIQAHARIGDAPPLLLAGPKGWQLADALAGAGERAGAVRQLGYVSDADLAALYRLCTVFAYPSLYEGFGLPLLEAMSCGAACVTSNRSSLPEVGGDAVAYADPTDADSIASAIERLLASLDERAELGRRAGARARTFSWGRTARETVAVLESLVA
jgi:glycosyltransferase involved in cell wall biosynthesis